ncbi:hypothetical protein BC829DRAFT_438771 [Chytridium lagenaria]|nr:hypothetical protein BC829DRAFT_438771 [Chytridium lagenaria]
MALSFRNPVWTNLRFSIAHPSVMNQSLSQAGPQSFHPLPSIATHESPSSNNAEHAVYMEPSVSSIGPIGSGLRGRANARMERQESWGRPRAEFHNLFKWNGSILCRQRLQPIISNLQLLHALSPLLKPYFGTSLNSNTHTPPSSLSRTFGQMSPSRPTLNITSRRHVILGASSRFLGEPCPTTMVGTCQRTSSLAHHIHQRSLPTLDQHVEFHTPVIVAAGALDSMTAFKIETTYSKGEYDRRPSSPEPLTQSDIVKHLLFRSSLPLSPDMSRIASADGYFNPQSIKPHQTASQYMPLSPTFQIQRELVGIKPHAPDVLSPSTKSSTKSSSKLQNLLPQKTSQVDIDEEVVEKLVKAASVCAREAVMGMPLTDIDGLTRSSLKSLTLACNLLFMIP